MENALTDLMQTENRAGICRITCGWKKPELSLDVVCRYWRDVHSPGIARRPGVWEYRHFQYAPVQSDVFAPLKEVSYACPAEQQLMWQSDVRYENDAALLAFSAEPKPEVLKQLLGDIEIIVDKSTTYKVLGDKAWTFADRSGTPAPQGPVQQPTYSVFFRQRGKEDAFRAVVKGIAQRWAKTAGVVRVRMSLFEVPDMEAERKAGYPIKTHPTEMQYQALIDLSVDSDTVARSLLSDADGVDYAAHISAIHAYPVRVIYTSICHGLPTIVGLRGYPAYDAMRALNAVNQRDLGLLTWMYGPVVQTGPVA
jgi:hypothetical protein